MAGIPNSSRELSPQAQQLLEFLRQNANQQFTMEQLAQALGRTAEETQMQVEALEYQGEIEKAHPAGGEAVYFRPQHT